MSENPFVVPGSEQSVPAGPPADASAIDKRLSGCASVLLGALVGILGAFPVAVVVAVVYRFPVPFAGYASGFRAVLPVLFAVLFYGLLGGFLVVGVLGALAGLLASQITHRTDAPRKASVYLIVSLALAANLPPVLLLAVLDKIIGPW